MEVEDGILKYYKEENGRMQCQGTLNFDLYQCFIEQDAGKKVQFKISFNGNSREFWFKAKTEAEAASWVAVIDQHIRASKGFKEAAMAPLTSTFWRQEQISEAQFLDIADTFDILLFRCNTSGGKIIRTYTGSEFGKCFMN